MPIVIWLIVLFNSMTSFADSRPVNALKAQAQQLLEGGITLAEHPKAIEVLLKLSTAQPKVSFPPWYIAMMIITLCISLVLLFPPPAVLLGVGDGQDRINYWHNRLRVTFYVIPGFLFLTFIVPVLQELWGKLF